MKHKTAELTGALLDEAVALALGWRVVGDSWVGATSLDGRVTRDDEPAQSLVRYFHPSSLWQYGGPIIDRERIGLLPPIYGITDKWATTGFSSYGEGQTALIAAMRAYVASRFGEEVELP